MPIVAAVAVPHPPIILPQVGHGEEAAISKTTDAYRTAMAFVLDAGAETVVVISPHADAYADYFCLSPGAGARGDFARFGAPGLKVQATYDTALAAAIEKAATAEGLPAGFEGIKHPGLDHGTTIPLVFLGQVAGGQNPCKVVRIGLSGLDEAAHYRMGRCIAAAAGEKRVAVVGSGDLSHMLKEDGPYGFVPEGPKLDEAICKALAAGDFGALLAIEPALAEKGAECGLRSFIMMAGALDGLAVQAGLLSYEGPFGVGYAVATFGPEGPDDSRRFLQAHQAAAAKAAAARRQREDACVALAHTAMEHYLQTGKKAARPAGLPAGLTGRRAGAFVTLHQNGRLRGCIGTISPTADCLADEIMQNAVSSATEDPRFEPVGREELDGLEIHVDVLGTPEPVAGPEALDPKRFGVIVTNGGRRGLLLPDLDGVDTPGQQVEIARQKAGIPTDAPLRLERFEVVRHQ